MIEAEYMNDLIVPEADENFDDPSLSLEQDDDNEGETNITPEDKPSLIDFLEEDKKILDYETLLQTLGDETKDVMIASLVPYNGQSNPVEKETAPLDEGKIYLSVIDVMDEKELEALKDANFELLEDIYFVIPKDRTLGEIETPSYDVPEEPANVDEGEGNDDGIE